MGGIAPSFMAISMSTKSGRGLMWYQICRGGGHQRDAKLCHELRWKSVHIRTKPGAACVQAKSLAGDMRRRTRLLCWCQPPAILQHAAGNRG